jgi:hypothetical protein
VERSSACSGEPSLSCATWVVLGPLLALAGGVAVGIGLGVTMAFHARDRVREATVTALSALAVLVGVHLLLVL